MASKGLVVRYPDGRQYGVRDAAAAERLHPEAKVVGYTDGSPLETAEVPSGNPSDKWNRDQLNAYAVSLGIESPEALGTKAELLKAIQEHVNPSSGTTGDGTDDQD